MLRRIVKSPLQRQQHRTFLLASMYTAATARRAFAQHASLGGPLHRHHSRSGLFFPDQQRDAYTHQRRWFASRCVPLLLGVGVVGGGSSSPSSVAADASPPKLSQTVCVGVDQKKEERVEVDGPQLHQQMAAKKKRPPVKGLVSSAKKPNKVTFIGDNPLARWSQAMGWDPSVCGCPTMVAPSPIGAVVGGMGVGISGADFSTSPSFPTQSQSVSPQQQQQQHQQQQRRLVLPMAVGLEGCSKAFNATNALRTSLYFGACCPPTYMGASSAADILSLQDRRGGSSKGSLGDTEEKGKGVACAGATADGSDGDNAHHRGAGVTSIRKDTCISRSTTMLYGPVLPTPSIDAYVEAFVSWGGDAQRKGAEGGGGAGAEPHGQPCDAVGGDARRHQWPVVALENYTDRCVSIHTARMTDAFSSIGSKASGEGISHPNNTINDTATAAMPSTPIAAAASTSGKAQNPHSSTTSCDTSSSISSTGLCILMGDENKGVSAHCLDAASLVVYVPQYGTISSLNVVTTLGLALFYAWVDMVCPQNRELVVAAGDGSGGGDGSTTAATAVGEDSASSSHRPIREVLGDYFSAFQKDLPMTLEKEEGATDGGDASPTKAADGTVNTPTVVVRANDDAEEEGGGTNSNSASHHRQQHQQAHVVPWDGSSSWNNIKPGLDRVDARPIHPLFYQMSDDGIGARYKAFYDALEGLCRPLLSEMVSREMMAGRGGLCGDSVLSSSSTAHHHDAHQQPLLDVSLESLLPCALYENDFDQRNLGGLIRNANAFMCPRVYYVGKKKINIKGAVGCNHYTPPIYLGKFRESEGYQQMLLAAEGGYATPAQKAKQKKAAEGTASSTASVELDAVSSVKAMLAHTGRTLWFLSCDHDGLYTVAPPSVGANGINSGMGVEGDGGDGDGGAVALDPKFANCYSTQQSLEAYARLCARSGAAVTTAPTRSSGSSSTCLDCPFTVNLTDSELSIRTKLVYNNHFLTSSVYTGGDGAGGREDTSASPHSPSHHHQSGIVLLIPQEGKAPHHELLDLCVGIVRVLPRSVEGDGTAANANVSSAVKLGESPPPPSSSSLSSSSAATTTPHNPLVCRGLPSQVASGIALHRIVTSCAPCLKL